MTKLAYSVQEAAEALSLSRRTVYRMVRDGRIPYKRTTTTQGDQVGGRIIIPRAALERWLTEPPKQRRKPRRASANTIPQAK